MTSDQRNFSVARKINWRVNDLSDAFSDAARHYQGVKFVFAADNGSVIDFCLLDYQDSFRQERIHSLLQHDYVPLGFILRNHSGVLYLNHYDHMRLSSWALELLEQFRMDGGIAVSHETFNRIEEQIEMRNDQREADWLSFITHLIELPDWRTL